MLQQPLDRHLLPLRAESYVMKMYCPCISILGYTSPRRKSEKFINIHLNKKTLRRSSVTHFKKQPPEVFYKKAVLNLKICNIHHKKKHLCCSLFLIKLLNIRPAALSKRDSSTGVFLVILQNL